MTFSVKIIRGDDAHKMRCTPELISQWQSLAEVTDHVTVFQEPAFVNCWYERYSPEFTPVLVLGYDTNKQLIGLLPLAIEKISNKLTHAAAQQVEYSGWLTHPSYKDEFILKAITKVIDEISYSSWRWSFLPPKSEADWLLNSKSKQVYFNYEKVSSPILDLHDEEKVQKIKKSKSVKSKINRLKRIGDLSLEHITDTKRAKEVMDLIPDLVNFRHGAAHGDLAFREDPLQHGFYISRCENLIENHFSALWAGDTLIAFHFGGIDKDTIYIGLTAFDPRVSKHSPGVVFILYLAEMMKQQGIRYIDLTPGGDEYKERFCNKHNILYRPIIFSTRAGKLLGATIRKMKTLVLNTLSTLGIDRDSLSDKLQGKNKPQPPADKYKLFSLNFNNIDSAKIDKDSTSTLNVQKYNDLLIHQGYSSSLEMQKLLNDATQRFSREETLFTLMEEDKLMGYAWLSKPGVKYRNHGLELSLNKTEVVIDCIEVEKTLPDMTTLEKMLPFILSYAIEAGAEKSFSYIPENSSLECIALIEKSGFTAVH